MKSSIFFSVAVFLYVTPMQYNVLYVHTVQKHGHKHTQDIRQRHMSVRIFHIQDEI